jgi:hypothetical protein
MPQSSDPRQRGIGIDIQAAHANCSRIVNRSKQTFAQPIEAIRPGLPLIFELAHEGQPELLTLGNEFGQHVDRG